MPISTSGLSVPQLGQQFDTSMYGNATPIKQELPKGMSIGDMLDISKKTLDLRKAKETYEPEVSKVKAESERLQNEAKKSGIDLNMHTQNMANSVYGGYLTDPDFISGNSAKMVEKLKRSRTYLEDNGLVPPNQGKGHDALLDLAKNDPAAAYQMIKNGVQTAGGNASQYQSLQNAQPPALYTGNQVAPQNPSQPQGQPQGQPIGQPAGQQTNLPNPELSQPVPLLYPVRSAGQPFAAAPSEGPDKDAGIAYRDALLKRQSTLTTDRRNLDEVIKKAAELEKAAYLPTSGILGAAERATSGFFGTEQGIRYKELSKDLANAQVANFQAHGGSMDSVEGLRLKRLQNGDETYPPKILQEIAQRTKSDLTNLDMQATAAQKFANRFGDNNMKSFMQMWAKNADSKIFEVMNVAKDQNMSSEEKKKFVDNILGNDPQQRKIFHQKYQNILKLEKDGTL